MRLDAGQEPLHRSHGLFSTFHDVSQILIILSISNNQYLLNQIRFNMKAGSVQGKVRDNHIVKDNVTSRDLLGFVRGRCSGCASCGKYIIYTKEKYYKKGVRS